MTHDKKYELVREDSKKIASATLFRIRAVRSFGNVLKGELGGYVESEKNLLHDGDAWVSGNANVFGHAKISGHAKIFGHVEIFGHAEISGDVWVSGNAKVFGHAKISGDAWVSGGFIM